MSWKDRIEPIVLRIPSVERPEGHASLKQKLLWTSFVLLVYFFLTNVLLLGLGTGGSDLFGQFRSILAGGQGTILQLGIGPIVTASIVLQLLDGAGILGLDTQNNPRDQAIYQGLQKLLVIVMVFVTGAPIVFSSFLPASPALASTLGVSLFAVELLMFVQVIIGGILILYMDEVISKWGVGSGVGLFIVAGVSQRLFTGLLVQILPTWFGFITGQTPINPLTQAGLETLIFGAGSLLAIVTTVLIFAFVVYAESTRVEIPIQNQGRGGGGGRYPLKLIYASVLPLILVRALQANIQFIGRILRSQLGAAGMPDWLGVYSQTQNGLVVQDGLFYLLAPIQSPQQWMWWTAGTAQDPIMIIGRILFDVLFMVVGGGFFALYWVRTTGMAAEDVAKKIQSGGLQIPGFRQSPRAIERVLDRYIPYVTILGGVIVGLLAILANMLGTIGGVTGTGLLLMVSITYKVYQEIAEEQLKEMYPSIRRFFES